MSRRLTATDKGLLVLLVAFACLAATYSIVNPIFEAPDEIYHYPFVKHLADGHGLPIQDPDNQGPWHQEGSQPPLYYFLASLASRWAPSGGPDELPQLYPHASVGVVRPDGHANMVVHTSREDYPYRGVALAVHLARGVSVVLGTLTVLFAYCLGRELLPGRPVLALAGAAVVAFTPMFLFISGSVNNDNLVITLSTASLWLSVRMLRLPPTPGRWALLGAVIGLASLAKVSALGLALVAALALGWVAWRERDWRVFLWSGACAAGAAVLVAGWWYYRNWRLYGDPLGWSVFVAIARPRPHGPTLAQLWSEVPGLVRSYWGVFGWLNVSAPPWFYPLCSSLALPGLSGLLVEAGWRLWARRWPTAVTVTRLGLVALWPLVVVVSLVRWTSLTMGTQGRLLFPAIASLSYLMVLGYSSWASMVRLPSSVKRQTSGTSHPTFDVSRLTFHVSRLADQALRTTHYASRLTPFLPPVLLAALAIWIPFGVIAPAYARPPLLTRSALADIPNRLDLSFGDHIELLGYEIGMDEVRPGDDLRLTLYWRATGPLARNYSVFIHLLDENGYAINQRDAYPGGGLFPTTLWQAGDAFADSHVVSVPSNTFNPNRLSLAVGLYTLESGARLLIRDSDGRQLGDSIRIGDLPLHVEPVDGIANPVHSNLEDKVALVGYDLDRIAMRPGETLRLTLFWETLAPLGGDHTISARILGVDGSVWTERDGWPLVGAEGPSVGVIRSSHDLALRPDAPDGAYYVVCSLRAAGSPGSLSLLDRWGRPQSDRVVLARIRVARNAPPEVAEPMFAFPQIEHPLDVTFGDVARLKGFTLGQEAVHPSEELRLTLYWQATSEAPAPRPYVVFTHLLDPQNRMLAQHDGVPSCGYWPVTAWRQGQAIVDRHDLAFTVADYVGEGLLEVGLYDPETLQRLPTSEGSDRVILPVRVMVRR